MLINKLCLLVARLSVTLQLELVQFPLMVEFNPLRNLLLYVFEHRSALDSYRTQFFLSVDLELILFVSHLCGPAIKWFCRCDSSRGFVVQ